MMQRLHIFPLTMKDVSHFSAELPEKPRVENKITQLWNQHESLLSLKAQGCWHWKRVVCFQ